MASRASCERTARPRCGDMTDRLAAPSFSSIRAKAQGSSAMSKRCRAGRRWQPTLTVSTPCVRARRFLELFDVGAFPRLVLEAAERAHHTCWAVRLARNTRIAPMQDQPMVRMLDKVVGHDFV